MTKLERKIEARMTKDSSILRFGFLVLSLIRHSSFVLRHFAGAR